MELKEVFEPVLNFIKNFQKKDKETASKQAAKDRLKLVLMQDRASDSPDFFEMMKKEIIDVIKKYIEIDEEALEVQLTRGLEAGLEGPALYANIPIKNVKPVAPKGEEEKDENESIAPVMTEEKAEEVAEQILNQIEESVGAASKTESNQNVGASAVSENKTPSNENVGAGPVSAQKEANTKPKKTVRKTTTTKSTSKKTTTKKTTKSQK